MPHQPPTGRAWISRAIGRITADFNRSSDTNLLPATMPEFPGISFYFKDEAHHPTGSLKHRLARSLFLCALADGCLRENTTIVEASSGSTAVSEAYFARLIGVPFVAVMPRSTSPDKVAAIEFQGGRCHFVDCPSALRSEAAALAARLNGHFMDQFTFAERAMDWRANNNIAASIFRQMQQETHPVPRWIVCGAGTGATAATLGRHVRYRGLDSRILCVDPEGSAFFSAFRIALGECDPGSAGSRPSASRIEGIGRPELEPSFIPGCIDAMAHVPDALSLAGMRYVNRLFQRRVGGSTGTNFIGMIVAAIAMRAAGENGSIVTIICDGGERYAHSYYNPEWYGLEGIPVHEADAELARAIAGGGLGLLGTAGDSTLIEKVLS